MRGSWPPWLIRLAQAGIILAIAFITAAYFYGLLDPQLSDTFPKVR